jgi:hypothetical protein
MAVANVIDKSTTLPKDRRPDSTASQFDQMKVALRGLIPLKLASEEETLRQASVKSLGLACAQFGELIREKLGMEDIGAIMKAFPGLMDADIADSPGPDAADSGAQNDARTTE